MSSALDGEALFSTARLRCRRWLATDFDALYAVYSDPEGARWVGDGQPITRNEARGWFEVTAQNYATRGYGMFALDNLADDSTVGFAGLVHPDNQTDAEIKYAFLQSHWGQGLASELVPALLAYGARSHDLERIIATVAPENLASQRVLLKAGMRFVETFVDDDGDTTQLYVWEVG